MQVGDGHAGQTAHEPQLISLLSQQGFCASKPKVLPFRASIWAFPFSKYDRVCWSVISVIVSLLLSIARVATRPRPTA